MTSNVHPNQEQLFATGDLAKAPRWKLDDDSRRIGRCGLKKARHELEKLTAPTPEPRRPRSPSGERSTTRSTAYIARGYKNAA